jgi:hypothetical protein
LHKKEADEYDGAMVHVLLRAVDKIIEAAESKIRWNILEARALLERTERFDAAPGAGAAAARAAACRRIARLRSVASWLRRLRVHGRK